MAPRRQRQERIARARLAALLGALALLVQALLPAAALAAQARSGGEPLVICTASGARTVTADALTAAGKPGSGHYGGHDGGFAGLPCQNCLAAAIAALPIPEPDAAPVRYRLAQRVELRPERAAGANPARAPPRPPGQGPPQA